MADRLCTEHDDCSDFTALLACCKCKSITTSLHCLPCAHIYCNQCLSQHILQDPSTSGSSACGTYTCPKCEHTFYWNGEKTAICRPGKMAVETCTSCLQETTSTQQCQFCDDHHCEACFTQLHEQQGPLLPSPIQERGEIDFLERSDHTGATGGTSAAVGANREKRCAPHNNRPLDYHCGSCVLFICELCCEEEHASHTVKSVENVMGERKHDLRKNIVDIQNRIREGCAASDSMADSLARLDLNKRKAKENLEKHIQHVREAFNQNLKQKEVELLNCLDDKYENVHQALTKQKEKVKKYVEKLNITNDLANNVFNNGSLEDLVTLQHDVNEKIRSLAQERPRPLKPVHYGNLEFHAKELTDPHFDECFQNFGHVVCNPLIGSLYTSSLILREESEAFVETLENWMKDLCKWRLCYRASRDGWSAETFHKCCDRVGPTVTLIKVGVYIFGGYTDESWEVTAGYKQSTKTFLFSLRNRDNLEPFKAPVVQHQNAIICHKNFGPTFGWGYDIYIANNANRVTHSYTKFGYSYRAPDGYDSCLWKKNQHLLAGKYCFTPDEIEVFY